MGIEHSLYFVFSPSFNRLEQSFIRNMLIVPEASPGLTCIFLRWNHLELSIHIKVLIKIGRRIFLLDITLNVVYTQIFIFSHIIDELHLVGCNCPSWLHCISMTSTFLAINNNLIFLWVPNEHGIATLILWWLGYIIRARTRWKISIRRVTCLLKTNLF